MSRDRATYLRRENIFNARKSNLVSKQTKNTDGIETVFSPKAYLSATNNILPTQNQSFSPNIFRQKLAISPPPTPLLLIANRQKRDIRCKSLMANKTEYTTSETTPELALNQRISNIEKIFQPNINDKKIYRGESSIVQFDKEKKYNSLTFTNDDIFKELDSLCKVIDTYAMPDNPKISQRSKSLNRMENTRRPNLTNEDSLTIKKYSMPILTKPINNIQKEFQTNEDAHETELISVHEKIEKFKRLSQGEPKTRLGLNNLGDSINNHSLNENISHTTRSNNLTTTPPISIIPRTKSQTPQESKVEQRGLSKTRGNHYRNSYLESVERSKESNISRYIENDQLIKSSISKRSSGLSAPKSTSYHKKLNDL